MTLFQAEWKKLAGGKFLFLLLTLFAAAQGVLSYCLTPVDEYAEAYRKICSFAADALYGDGGLYLMRGASRFYRMDVQTGECISVTGDGWQKAE